MLAKERKLFITKMLQFQACDNGMLQILGATCRHLEHLDIWKSTGVTDSGIAMLLGLEAEKPFKVCSTLRKVQYVFIEFYIERKILSKAKIMAVQALMQSNGMGGYNNVERAALRLPAPAVYSDCSAAYCRCAHKNTRCTYSISLQLQRRYDEF